MMTLSQASDLLEPHLEHPDFIALERTVPRLQELVRKIARKMNEFERPDNFLRRNFGNLDKETEKLIREFDRICQEGLR